MLQVIAKRLGASPRSVAGQNAYLYIGGQSNAVGVADYTELLEPPLSNISPSLMREFQRVWIWNAYATTPQWERLQVPVNNLARPEENGYPASIGPEVGLAQRWEAEQTGNLYLLKCAAGGTTIEQWTKSANHLYPRYFEWNTPAEAALAAQGITYTKIGFLWIQGEYNANDSQADYYAKLVQFMSDFTGDFLTAESIKVVGEVYVANNSGYPGEYTVSAAQQQYVAGDPQARFLPTSALVKTDVYHYDTVSQLHLGDDTYDLLMGTSGDFAGL